MPHRIRAGASAAKIQLMRAIHEFFARHKHHVLSHPMFHPAMLPALWQLAEQRAAFSRSRFRLAIFSCHLPAYFMNIAINNSNYSFLSQSR